MPVAPRLENLPDVLTIRQVARVLQISDKHAYTLAENGTIPVLRLSRKCLRVVRKDLERMLGGENAGPDALVAQEQKKPA